MSSPCLSASSVASGESLCVSLNSAMQFGGLLMPYGMIVYRARNHNRSHFDYD
jgi:hypothetical protein